LIYNYKKARFLSFLLQALFQLLTIFAITCYVALILY